MLLKHSLLAAIAILSTSTIVASRIIAHPDGNVVGDNAPELGLNSRNTKQRKSSTNQLQRRLPLEAAILIRKMDARK